MNSMESIKDIVVFDFCQTLCNFETADAFVEYVCQRETNHRIRLLSLVEKIIIKSKIIVLFDLYGHIMHHSLWKRFLLEKLKGIEKDTLELYAECYYRERIKPNLIPDTLQRLTSAHNKGINVAIVSASYEVFLKLFAQDYNVDLLVSNQFLYDKKGRFLGRFKGKDCIYTNKVKRFYDALSPAQVNVFESYGDSRSDIPILSIAQNAYVISRHAHKKWVDKTNFNEIIWQ